MTFSGFRERTFSLFKRQKLLKFLHLVHVNTASYMLQYGLGNLPVDFDDICTVIKHDYATRLASTMTTNAYIITPVCINYGIFSIRYSGPKVWSSVDESLKSLNLNIFKRKLKYQILGSYQFTSENVKEVDSVSFLSFSSLLPYFVFVGALFLVTLSFLVFVILSFLFSFCFLFFQNSVILTQAGNLPSIPLIY